MVSSPVTTEARRILRHRTLIVAALAATALLGLGSAALLVVTGHPAGLALLALPLFAVTLLGSTAGVLRTPLGTPPSVMVDRSNAAPLLDLVADLSKALNVDAPDDVAIIPTCAVRLEYHDRRLVLEVGAPVLWSLDHHEMRAVLAPAVAASPEMRTPVVGRAMAMARRLETARIGGRVAAPLLRGLRAHCLRHEATLEMELAAAALSRSTALYRPELQSKLESITETWNIVLDGFAAPALRRGLRPKRLCTGLARLAAGSDLVDKRSYVPERSAAATLLTDAGWIDCAVSTVVAETLWNGRVRDAVEWSHYTDRVLAPLRREQAAELLAAVDTVMGTRGPGTLDRVLDSLDLGAARAIEAVLARSGPPARSGDDGAELSRRLAALVECAAVTTGTSRLELSWLTGAVVVHEFGHVLSLDDDAVDLAAKGHTRELRTWLVDQPISLTEPVWVSGDERPDVGPVVLATLSDVWHHGRRYDLIMCEDRLVFLLAGRHPACVRADVTRLLAESKRNFHIELESIVDTRLRAMRWPRLWRCVISTIDRRVVLSNRHAGSTAAALRDLLRPSLGDRFRAHGLDARPVHQSPLIPG